MQERTRQSLQEVVDGANIPPGSMAYPPCRCGRPECQAVLRKAVKRAREVKLQRRKGMAR